MNHTAEEIFKHNIGDWVMVNLMSHNVIIYGELLDIKCNVFIVKNKKGHSEMFRYEDLIWLVSNNEWAITTSYQHIMRKIRNY